MTNNTKFSAEKELEICAKYQTPLANGDLPTAKEIGDELGCNDVTIRNILLRNGVTPRKNKGRQASRLFDKETEIAACEYYWIKLQNGYYPSYEEVGRAFGCTDAHVRNLLKRHGYKRRTNAETRDKRPCKPITRGAPEGEIAPLCACGCGNAVSWCVSNYRWYKYVRGHTSKLYHDPEWLHDEYHGKGRSLADIAKQFNVNSTSIINSMNKHGIKRRTTGETLILRGSTSGANNPAWKGGVAKWNYSPDWKRLCKQIKNRDKWTCQLCDEQRKRWGNRLHVHHIDEDKTNNHPHNLISLCSACHAPIHGIVSIRAKLIAIASTNTAMLNA